MRNILSRIGDKVFELESKKRPAAPAPQAEGTRPELSHALETLKSVRTRLVEKVGNLQNELESLTDVIDSIEGKP